MKKILLGFAFLFILLDCDSTPPQNNPHEIHEINTLLYEALGNETVDSGIYTIDFNKIPKIVDYLKEIIHLSEIEYTAAHWSFEWNFSIPKQEVISLIKTLYEEYQVIYNIDQNNIDLALFYGQLACYLYHLDAGNYYQDIIDIFNHAKQLAPDDLRPYWLSGIFYAQAGKTYEGMNEMLKTARMLPYSSFYAQFWEDYTLAAYMSGMFSHSLMALQHYNELMNRPSKLVEIIGKRLLDTMIFPDTSMSIQYDELWKCIPKEYIHSEAGNGIINKAFGICFTIQDNWESLSFAGCDKGVTNMRFKIKAIDEKENIPVYSHILLLSRVAQKETLDEFVNALFLEPALEKGAGYKKVDDFPEKYAGLATYEIIDPGLYGIHGDGRIFFIAFELYQPTFPGVLLKRPIDISKIQETDETKYLRMNYGYTRFSGLIFYIIMLDSCDAVYDKAFQDFYAFVMDNLVVE
jgi:hypothetical protein